MALGVNTNVGAMVALQNLSKTNKELETVQGRINTGLSVASAKDNGGVYAIAQSMRGDVASLGAVGTSLSRAKSVVDVALAAGDSISDLLVQMKEKAVAASDASVDTTARNALNEDFVALRKQIASIVSTANFAGKNLISSGRVTSSGAGGGKGSASRSGCSGRGCAVTVAALIAVVSKVKGLPGTPSSPGMTLRISKGCNGWCTMMCLPTGASVVRSRASSSSARGTAGGRGWPEYSLAPV